MTSVSSTSLTSQTLAALYTMQPSTGTSTASSGVDFARVLTNVETQGASRPPPPPPPPPPSSEDMSALSQNSVDSLMQALTDFQDKVSSGTLTAQDQEGLAALLRDSGIKVGGNFLNQSV